MEQPPGFSIEGGTDKVCLLRHVLYGLKQSLQAWFAKFSELISTCGLVSCDMEPTIFCKTTLAGCIILAVYMDDMIITGSDRMGIQDVKTFLHQHFDIRNLGEPRYFLGIEFASRLGALILNQCKYILNILQEASMFGCKPYASPIDSKPQLWSTTSLLYIDPK